MVEEVVEEEKEEEEDREQEVAEEEEEEEEGDVVVVVEVIRGGNAGSAPLSTLPPFAFPSLFLRTLAASLIHSAFSLSLSTTCLVCAAAIANKSSCENIISAGAGPVG